MDFLQRGRGDRQARLIPNIILVGLPGSGKSTVGGFLARRFGFGFLDLDTWVEQSCKKSVAQIFQEDGEAFFREKESEAIQDIANVCNHVIAVGGGAVSSPANWQILSELGVSVWINCLPAMIAKRLAADPGELVKRPLLQDLAAEDDKELRFQRLLRRLEDLLEKRQPAFELAQFVVYESFAPPDDCARRLKRLLESRHAHNILKKAKKASIQQQR